MSWQSKTPIRSPTGMAKPGSAGSLTRPGSTPCWRCTLIAFYLSMGHREERMDGCPVVALGSDAARQSSDVKASFEAGIKSYLEMLDRWIGETDGEESTDKAMAILSTMVGALVLSRAINNKRLSKRLLQAAAKSTLMISSARDTQRGPL